MIRVWFLAALLSFLSTTNLSAASISGSRYRAYAIKLDSETFSPPSKNDIKRWGKEVTVGSAEIEALFRAGGSGPRNEGKSLRIVLIDEQNKNEIYIMRDKKAIFKGRELPIQTAAIDAIIDQIKRAPAL